MGLPRFCRRARVSRCRRVLDLALEQRRKRRRVPPVLANVALLALAFAVLNDRDRSVA